MKMKMISLLKSRNNLIMFKLALHKIKQNQTKSNRTTQHKNDIICNLYEKRTKKMELFSQNV